MASHSTIYINEQIFVIPGVVFGTNASPEDTGFIERVTLGMGKH